MVDSVAKMAATRSTALCRRIVMEFSLELTWAL
jgi:hypothetical protein